MRTLLALTLIALISAFAPIDPADAGNTTSIESNWKHQAPDYSTWFMKSA